MHLLYIMQYFSSPNGSYSTRTYEFARRLASQGHSVSVITSNAMMPEFQNIDRTIQATIADINCIVIPVAAPYAVGISFKRRILGYIKFNLSAFRQITKHRADVVIASSPPLPISIPGIWAKIWHRAPLIFEVRDLWPEMPIAVGALNNPLLRVLARALEWVSYRLATHVIALSPGMAEGIAAQGIKRNKITIIPNSCDISEFSGATNPKSIRDKIGISDEAPLIVYAGAFGLLNDPMYLIDVAKFMINLRPDAHFLLIGTGINWNSSVHRAKVLNLLDKNVHIWPSIPKSSIPNLLAAATVVTSLFVPIRAMWKNSANKFFDGLAAGRPMAINYGDWHADLLASCGAGIVMPPSDPEAGALQLANFISDPVRLEKAAKASIHLAESQFNRNDMAQILEQVIWSSIRREAN